MNDMRTWIALCEAKTPDQLHTELADRYQFQQSDQKTLQGLTKDSKDLNRHLHAQYAAHKKIPDLKRTRQLDAAIAQYQAPFAFDVYYGASHDVEPGLYHHAGYLHTSLSIDVAIGFANVHPARFLEIENGIAEHNHVIKILVPQGQHGAYVGHISKSDKAKKIPSKFNLTLDDPSTNELEFILPRNTTLMIRFWKTEITSSQIFDDEVHEVHRHMWKATIVS